MAILQVVRILGLSMLGFLVALVITPWVSKLLYRFNLNKQIRTSDATPIFSKLHEKKAGTPTMGGIIIWATVLGMALLFWILSGLFDGLWGYLNFVDRAQTYLPIAAMFIAATLGLADDLLGVLKIGPHGGGFCDSLKLCV